MQVKKERTLFCSRKRKSGQPSSVRFTAPRDGGQESSKVSTPSMNDFTHFEECPSRLKDRRLRHLRLAPLSRNRHARRDSLQLVQLGPGALQLR